MGDLLGLVSLVLAIPLSILGNWLTPHTLKLFGKYNTKLRTRIEMRKVREDGFIDWLAAHPDAMHMHFSRQNIGVAVMLLGSMFFYILYLVLPGKGFGNAAVETFLKLLMFFTQLIFMFAGVYKGRKLKRTWIAVLKRNGWMAWDRTRWSKESQKWVDIACIDHKSDLS